MLGYPAASCGDRGRLRKITTLISLSLEGRGLG